jgi:CBS domain containing-hemolysin-like protein
MGLLIIYAFVSIFFSFLCSILEAVLLSITPTFINVKKQEGASYIDELEGLKKDVDRPLIAILTLNTVAHTVGAILVGVQAKAAYLELYGEREASLFGMAMTEDLMVGIVSTIMTILILVASEIIPKTIGATYWRELAPFATRVLNFLILPLKYTGIIWMLQLTTRLVGGKSAHGSALSREYFSLMAEMAEKEGVFEEKEGTLIRNLLNFSNVAAQDIMTPRPVMKIEEEGTSVQDFFTSNPNLRFSRIPVYKNEVQNVTGIVLKDDIYREMANDNHSKALAEIKRPVIIIERDMPIPAVFDRLIESKNHMAVVVDNYGSVSGVVTMEDIIETLLGLEIMDESDNVADLQTLARQNWETRAKRLGILGEEEKPNQEEQ